MESSFLIDWFRGRDYARAYLDTVPVDTRLLVPTIVLYELFVGAKRPGVPPQTIVAVYQALDATEFVGFTPASAEEAADIRVTLSDRGERINAADVLIGAVARDAGATLVATDGHFDRIDDLAVHNPRSDAA